MHVLWPKADIDFRAITTGKVDNRRRQGPREQVGFRSLSSLIVYKQVVNSSIPTVPESYNSLSTFLAFKLQPVRLLTPFDYFVSTFVNLCLFPGFV